jgi:2-oxoglutarate dehydrogenase E1 component
MLRHPDAASLLAAFSEQRFRRVVPDGEIANASRLLLCTGKIGHELHAERKRRKDQSTAVVFLDQLYPFPEEELSAELERYPKAEIVWVQEEPANMGALFYVRPRLRRIAHGRPILKVARSASASPATGSAKAHELEQKTLLTLAFESAKT